LEGVQRGLALLSQRAPNKHKGKQPKDHVHSKAHPCGNIEISKINPRSSVTWLLWLPARCLARVIGVVERLVNLGTAISARYGGQEIPNEPICRCLNAIS